MTKDEVIFDNELQCGNAEKSDMQVAVERHRRSCQNIRYFYIVLSAMSLAIRGKIYTNVNPDIWSHPNLIIFRR